jgi:hypothetical protein
MSIADIMAIGNLLPESEPDFYLKPGEGRKPFNFRDDAERAAASADILKVLQRLHDEYGDDQAQIAEEFSELIKDDIRLLTAMVYDTVGELEAQARKLARVRKSRREEL